MNIVIVGAGNVGIHLASLFSQMNYGIVLVDSDPFTLKKVSRDLDIAVQLGYATDWELLENLMDLSPDLFIALTKEDNTNLVACSIAKQLGYPQTVARIRSNDFYKQSRIHFEDLFHVDHMIGPEKLASQKIANMILTPYAVESETFASGAIQTRTLKVPSTWRKGEIHLADKEKLELPEEVMVGLIKREYDHKTKTKHAKIFIPHGSDSILPSDEVTFIGETEAIYQLHRLFGFSLKIAKTAMIVGGSLTGVNLARILLDHHIRVTILEKDFAKCSKISEKLPNCTVIHRDGMDYSFLKSEKIENFDVFIACTRNDEVNFLAATIAKDLGCERAIISLSDTSYQPLVDKLGIDRAASARNYTANKILSIAREKIISSIASMYHNQAVVMEVKVSLDSKIAGIPIRQLGPQLPKDLLITMIQSRGRIFIADGNRVLTPGDTAIVFSSPKYVDEIKKLF